jgi:hypothetical protein
MKVVENTVEGVKFTFPMMVCSVHVAVWHYECRQLVNEIKKRLRQIQHRREEQDRIIRIIKGESIDTSQNKLNIYQLFHNRKLSPHQMPLH